MQGTYQLHNVELIGEFKCGHCLDPFDDDDSKTIERGWDSTVTKSSDEEIDAAKPVLDAAEAKLGKRPEETPSHYVKVTIREELTLSIGCSTLAFTRRFDVQLAAMQHIV